MGRFKDIKVDIYKRTITVYIGTKKELYKWCKKYYDEEDPIIYSVKKTIDDETAIGTCYNLGEGMSLVWIPKFPETPEEIASLVHELLHATTALLDFIGNDYAYNGSNEQYTYLLEYFVKEALTNKKYRYDEED